MKLRDFLRDIREGDDVIVNSKYKTYEGEIGIVVEIGVWYETYMWDRNTVFSFKESELDLL